jgi:hypothetical protein
MRTAYRIREIEAPGIFRPERAGDHEMTIRFVGRSAFAGDPILR